MSHVIQMYTNLATSQGYIFRILQHFAPKRLHFTIFGMPFHAIVMNCNISNFLKFLSIVQLVYALLMPCHATSYGEGYKSTFQLDSCKHLQFNLTVKEIQRRKPFQHVKVDIFDPKNCSSPFLKFKIGHLNLESIQWLNNYMVEFCYNLALAVF